MVEAMIQMSYLVLPDSDVRVYDVVLADTVMAADEHTDGTQGGQWDSIVIPFL